MIGNRVRKNSSLLIFILQTAISEDRSRFETDKIIIENPVAYSK